MTLNITTLSITMICHYGKCNYAKCRVLFLMIMSVVMLSVVMQSVVMLNVLAPDEICSELRQIIYSIAKKLENQFEKTNCLGMEEPQSYTIRGNFLYICH